MNDNHEIKVARILKENGSNQSKIDVIGEEKVYPVRTPWMIVDNKMAFQKMLKDDHTLFLTYSSSSNKEKGPVFAKAIRSWVKEASKEARIDTEIYKAHSLRAAARAEAVLKGGNPPRDQDSWQLEPKL